MEAAMIDGTSGNDILFGTADSDIINGFDGDDWLHALGGADFLYGGGNNDHLFGGEGPDVLDGGDGFDFARYDGSATGVWVRLDGGASLLGEAQGDTFVSIEGVVGSHHSDILVGNEGDNVLIGLDGDDALFGGAGADVLDGGKGSDTAGYTNATTGVIARLDAAWLNTGDAAGDTYVDIENLQGSNYGDVLVGDGGDNTIWGMGGDDEIVGLEGDDTLGGGKGNDRLWGGPGGDLLDGDEGFDFAHYDRATMGVTARLDMPGLNTGEAFGDTYFEIEGLVGSLFDDSLFGDAGANMLVGLRGNDHLYGGVGPDALDGGDGVDYAHYDFAAGSVFASLDPAYPDFAWGEAVGDTFTSIEGLVGSAHIDILVGNSGFNMLRGLGNSDGLTGGGGGDVLDGGLGSDTAGYANAPTGVTARLDMPVLNTGHAAGDSYVSIENLQGSAFKDFLVGDGADNSLYGEDGHDRLMGQGGADTIGGGIGNDQLWGGAAGDVLDGDEGFDLARYDFAPVGVTARLDMPGFNAGEAFGDRYFEIEGLAGSAHRDILFGDASANTLLGLGGNDTITGLGGNDVVEGGAGADQFGFTVHAAGADRITDFDTVGADHDFIMLTGRGLSYAGLGISDTAGGALVRISADETVLVSGIAAGALTADMFLF
jgi:Ca2+-binding RTX toxin-like protein